MKLDRIADQVEIVADPHVRDKLVRLVDLLDATDETFTIALEIGEREDPDFFDLTGDVDLELAVDEDVLDEVAKGVVDK